MNIKDVLNQSLEYKFASSDIPEFSDSSIKTKLNNVARKYNALYSDTGWEHVQKLQRELKQVLPTLSLFKSYYDNKMPNESKTWVMIGAFQSSKSIKSVWVHIKASGAGKIEDPLSKYDLVIQVEVLSPKNLDAESERFFKEIIE